MKPKHISFAHLLTSKAKTPQMELKNRNRTLAQLLNQWEQSPEEDYTLYLGQSRQSFNKQCYSQMMLASKNQREKPEQMFDSWIQRQSTLNANKENIVSHPKTHEQIKSYKQSELSSKFIMYSKQTRNGLKIIENQARKQQQQKMSQQSQFENVGEIIQMIKSKTCEREKGYNSSPIESNQIEYSNMEVEKLAPNKESNKEKRDNYKKQIREEYTHELVEPQLDESNKLQQAQSIIANLTNIEQLQVAEINQKYTIEQDSPNSKSPNDENQSEIEDDDLLIGQPLGSPQNNIPTESANEQIQKYSEIQKLRREDAKNKLTNLLKECLYKEKPFFPSKREEQFPTNQNKLQINLIGNEEVGYSFASNAHGSCKYIQFQSNQLPINNYQQTKSQSSAGEFNSNY